MKKMVLIILGIILLAGMVAYAGGKKEGAGEFPVKPIKIIVYAKPG